MPTTNRIIDITEGPVFLCYENKLLVVERKGEEDVTMPVDDIGVLILSSPHVSMTQPAIAELSKAGVCVVFCDRNAMPASMCLPFGVHHQPATRFRQQADASKPVMKRLWQEIVRSKLEHQAALLRHVYGTDYGLGEFPARVFSGDPDNVEAQGAKLYWSKLFGDVDFSRDRDAPGINALLNYGYTVLRAMTARAICSTGLHPGLGVHHHHRDNSFCLADDLMEPFRAYVDWAAYRWTADGKCQAGGLTKEDKANIVRQLLMPIKIEGNNEPLFYIIQRLASSLVNVFGWGEEGLRLPKPCFQ
ncbi:MAG: type II CRISPR-associated endonuclease Cas1 [Kiritimatiellaeota bacterium]|nr:type II CRISPR-associated endonuclease Cas1 [Kiritimatiellota bacterium]